VGGLMELSSSQIKLLYMPIYCLINFSFGGIRESGFGDLVALWNPRPSHEKSRVPFLELLEFACINESISFYTIYFNYVFII